MAHYAISDIHGCFDEFLEMLDQVHFSERDMLFLGGDYIDRGEKSAEMLRWLEDKPDNVICIQGNHDAEFVANVDLMIGLDRKEELDTDRDSNEDTGLLYDSMKYMLKSYGSSTAMYFDIYGGTQQMIQKGSTLNDLIRWAEMIRQMPLTYETDIGSKHFIIVHAGYIEDLGPVADKYTDIRDFNLYAREEAYLNGGKEHCTVIAGHTPTIVEGTFTFNHGEVFRYHDGTKNCTFYNIDCGCVMRKKSDMAALACLRLEDAEAFYV